MNKIPEKVNNFKAYYEGNELLGTVDVELPKLEAMTETIQGAGVAGEIDSPTLGHFKAFQIKLKFRIVTKFLFKLSEQRAHDINIKGALQNFDPGKGEYSIEPFDIIIRGVPKNIDLGTMQVGKPLDSPLEFELSYMKLVLSGKTMTEIDKFNFISNINGKDALADVRKALGM